MRDVSGSNVTPAAVRVSTCAPSGGGVRTRGCGLWGGLERPCCAPDASETPSQFFARVGGAGVTRAHDGQVERKQTVKRKKSKFPNVFPF